MKYEVQVMFVGLFFNSLPPASLWENHQINPNSLRDQYTLQNIKVMKNKHKKLPQKKTKDIWWLHTIWKPGLDPRTQKNTLTETSVNNMNSAILDNSNAQMLIS